MLKVRNLPNKINFILTKFLLKKIKEFKKVLKDILSFYLQQVKNKYLKNNKICKHNHKIVLYFEFLNYIIIL